MKYKDDILLILPKLSNKAKLNDLFNVYVILFNKLQQLGMKPEDFSSEVGILILDNSGISNTDESTNMLIQQISSIKIKQAFNAAFNSINEIHEDNINKTNRFLIGSLFYLILKYI